MKKTLLYIIGIFTLISVTIAAVIYRWTITPFGRISPMMAIIAKGMQYSPFEGMLASGDLHRIRGLMNRIRPRVTVAAVANRTIDGPGGPIPVRLYRPFGKGPMPVIVFYHGGGFALGSIASHENVARSIAEAAKAIVVSVEYRLAPEHPFPAAVDDAYAAVKWVAEQAATFNGDPSRIGVAGDSAGGNLAAVTAMRARDEKGPEIKCQILLYAALTFTDRDLPSRRNFAGYVLSEGMGQSFYEYYLGDSKDLTDPYLSPLEAEDHSNLPPAYIMTAEFDPLRDEGRLYANLLRSAGVQVTYREYAGLLHGFLSFSDFTEIFPGGSTLLKEPGYVYADIAALVGETLTSEEAVRV